MMPYLLSLGAGVLVGVIYALIGVRSPAPPTIALIGLLGMLVGEQVVPVVKALAAGKPVIALIRTDCARHILGPQAGTSAVPEKPAPQGSELGSTMCSEANPIPSPPRGEG